MSACHFTPAFSLFFSILMCNAPLYNHGRRVPVSNPASIESRYFNYRSRVTPGLRYRRKVGFPRLFRSLSVKTRASSIGIQPSIVSLNGMMRQTGCLRFRRQTVTVRLTWFTSYTPGTTGSGPSPPHILDFRSRALVRSNPGTSFYASPYRLCPTSLK